MHKEFWALTEAVDDMAGLLHLLDGLGGEADAELHRAAGIRHRVQQEAEVLLRLDLHHLKVSQELSNIRFQFVCIWHQFFD